MEVKSSPSGLLHIEEWFCVLVIILLAEGFMFAVPGHDPNFTDSRRTMCSQVLEDAGGGDIWNAAADEDKAVGKGYDVMGP